MLRDVGVPRELQMSQMAHSLKSQCSYSTFETLKCNLFATTDLSYGTIETLRTQDLFH